MQKTAPFLSPIGTSDFEQLRIKNLTYVDKTSWVRDVLLDTALVQLFPRPRRFGKTLNISALRYFVEKTETDRSALFKDLDIWQSAEARQHFQKYPTIFITFKDVKANDWEGCEVLLKNTLTVLLESHQYLLDMPDLSENEKQRLIKILNQDATLAEYRSLLKVLSTYLNRYHQQNVIILIDEYDTPIHEGFVHGYYDKVVDFFRGFLSAGLKDNSFLYKGVMTGILRVAKESLFSDLNNVEVQNILSPRYATSFGFTEEEVKTLAIRAGQHQNLELMQQWYNGYLFGGQVIYNPWSVMSYLKSPEMGFQPYWVSTSSNDLMKRLLLQKGFGLKGGLEELIQGKTIYKRLQENVALPDVEKSTNALWSFLLFCGYLKVVKLDYKAVDGMFATLALPNLEVQQGMSGLIQSWFEEQGEQRQDLLLQALQKGDAQYLQIFLSNILRGTLSYHDVPQAYPDDFPEKVYHALLLGLFVYLHAHYRVHSNLESGYGRADIIMIPIKQGTSAIVMELKVAHEDESLEDVSKRALRQLTDKQYRTLPELHGASSIHEIAVAFKGKKCLVKKNV